MALRNLPIFHRGSDRFAATQDPEGVRDFNLPSYLDNSQNFRGVKVTKSIPSAAKLQSNIYIIQKRAQQKT